MSGTQSSSPHRSRHPGPHRPGGHRGTSVRLSARPPAGRRTALRRRSAPAPHHRPLHRPAPPRSSNSSAAHKIGREMSADHVPQQRPQVICKLPRERLPGRRASWRAPVIAACSSATRRNDLVRSDERAPPASRTARPDGPPAARWTGPRARAAPAAPAGGRSGPRRGLSRSQPSSKRRSAQASSLPSGARRETRLQNARSSSSCSAVTTSMPWGRPPPRGPRAPRAGAIRAQRAHPASPGRRRTAAVRAAGP